MNDTDWTCYYCCKKVEAGVPFFRFARWSEKYRVAHFVCCLKLFGVMK